MFIVKTPPFVGTNIEPPAPEKEQTVWYCIAAKIFNRPPLFTSPFHAGKTSTVFIKVAFSDAAERFGLYAANNAAAPVTCGVAIDVPLRVAVAVSELS